jgi:hypothetical protein
VRNGKFNADVAAAISMAANRNGLDPCLLAGLVMKESSGNPAAIRYEPRYRWLWDVKANGPLTIPGTPPVVAPDSFPSMAGGVDPQLEYTLQRCSIGCAQVMGAVAREMGFSGLYLTELCDPITGIEYGARKLGILLSRFPEEAALSAYNAGRPIDGNMATYVHPIQAYRDKFSKEGF